MSKKKENEATTEDATDSIAPWVMLEDEEIESLTTRVRKLVPDRNLTAFAQRTDKGICVCFDRGEDGKGKSVVAVELATGSILRQFTGFSAWFDSALSAAGLA